MPTRTLSEIRRKRRDRDVGKCALPQEDHAYVALAAPPEAVHTVLAGAQIPVESLHLPLIDLGMASALTSSDVDRIHVVLTEYAHKRNSPVPVTVYPGDAHHAGLTASVTSTDLRGVRSEIAEALRASGIGTVRELRMREMTLSVTADMTRFGVGLGAPGGAYDFTRLSFLHQQGAGVTEFPITADVQNALTASVFSPVAGEKTGARFIIPMLVPEGIRTGDNRRFVPVSMRTRKLPLPLRWQIKSGPGHDGSVLVGRIDKIKRLPNGWGQAEGVFDTGEYGREAERLVRGGFLRGVSADLDKFEGESDEGEDSELISDEELKGESKGDKKSRKGKKRLGSPAINVSESRIMGATLVPMPAFQECTIEIVPDDEPEQTEEFPVSVSVVDGVYSEKSDSALTAAAIIAASIPNEPPEEWFTDPGLDKPTALTVTDEGRVFGHIAAWDVDHIGLPFGTRPPRSSSNYGYFHTGVVRTASGADVPVGQLTLAGGHAPLEATAAAAVRHYDDTASAFADVHAGEDLHGIWVAGALRPGTSSEQVRAIRASAPSGDWRPIGGRLELVAVCQVNVPGFPIARARVASGHVTALVAAGTAPLVALRESGSTDERLARLESALLGESAAPEMITASGSVEADDAAVIARRLGPIRAQAALHAFEAENGTPLIASAEGSFAALSSPWDIRRALHAYPAVPAKIVGKYRRHVRKSAEALGCSHLIPEAWNTKDAVSAEYRTVVASMTAASSPVSTAERKKMAKTGVALDDGSFPIPDVLHLKNAIRSYGRANEKDRAKVRRHIIRRARALGRVDLVPQSWLHTAAVRARSELRLRIPDAEIVADGMVAALAFAPKKREWDERLHPRHTYGKDRGKFRETIARIREDLKDEAGTSEAVIALEEAEAAEDAGNLDAAEVAARKAVDLVDDVAKHTIEPGLRDNFHQAGEQLGTAISNLGLGQGEDTVKYRYSDLPDVLQSLIEDLMGRLKAQVDPEIYAEHAGKLETYISGVDLMTIDDIHANLAGILALLV